MTNPINTTICELCCCEIDEDCVEPACEKCGQDGCCADCMLDHRCVKEDE